MDQAYTVACQSQISVGADGCICLVHLLDQEGAERALTS